MLKQALTRYPFIRMFLSSDNLKVSYFNVWHLIFYLCKFFILLTFILLLTGCAKSNTDMIDSVPPSLDGCWYDEDKGWYILFSDSTYKDSNCNVESKYSYDGKSIISITTPFRTTYQANVRVESNKVILDWYDGVYNIKPCKLTPEISTKFYNWSAIAFDSSPLYSYLSRSNLFEYSKLDLYKNQNFEFVIDNGMSTNIYYGKYLMVGTELYLLYNNGSNVFTATMYADGLAMYTLEGDIAIVQEGYNDSLIGVASLGDIRYIFTDKGTLIKQDGQGNCLEYRYSINNGVIVVTSSDSADKTDMLYYSVEKQELYRVVYKCQ